MFRHGREIGTRERRGAPPSIGGDDALDWRDGAAHSDASLAPSEHDRTYLEGRIEAGEAYEWHYASPEDRAAQTRTPITDGAHDEPWIYRAKDLRNFWSQAHYDRPAGVRSGSPTAWIPQSKPVWLTELGCPALDKGANAPNLFVDSKSSESALPPFSSGARDDLIQRRTLEAYLQHWSGDSESNPASGVYAGPMIDPGGVFVWCWDARPHPAFPARADVWADGDAWRLGHWLSGRAGLSGLGEVVAEICERAGMNDADVSGLSGAVSGYVIDGPAPARAALEPLMRLTPSTRPNATARSRFFMAATMRRSICRWAMRLRWRRTASLWNAAIRGKRRSRRGCASSIPCAITRSPG